MISIIYADIGTGKSCLLSYLAALAVDGKSINIKGLTFGKEKSYDYVYTNFPAFGCYKLDYDEIGEEDMSRSLLLLDEGQLEADSRNYKQFSDTKKMFFSLHRHLYIPFYRQDFRLIPYNHNHHTLLHLPVYIVLFRDCLNDKNI